MTEADAIEELEERVDSCARNGFSKDGLVAHIGQYKAAIISYDELDEFFKDLLKDSYI